MKILLLGANGQLGRELARQLPSIGTVTAYTRAALDITDHAAVRHAIMDCMPDAIVNAAAYTAVDSAEEETTRAIAINAEAVAFLAQLACKTGARLVHYSTDYVFDGTKSSPYNETDTPNPVNAYGQSKRAGEIAITEQDCDHLIFRTSWVIGQSGKNFAKTILHLATTRDNLGVINDQRGVPTSPALITTVTLAALRAVTQKTGWPAGIYHLTPQGAATWYDIAQTLLTFAAQQGVTLRTPAHKIRAIATAAYPTPAKRPLNSRLDTQKLSAYLSFCLPDWKDDFLVTAAAIIKELQIV